MGQRVKGLTGSRAHRPLSPELPEHTLATGPQTHELGLPISDLQVGRCHETTNHDISEPRKSSEKVAKLSHFGKRNTPTNKITL